MSYKYKSNIEEMSDEEGAEHDIKNLLNCLNNASYLVEILEGKGFKMRTIKQNIDFLIDGVEEWKELQGLRDDSEWRKHEQE